MARASEVVIEPIPQAFDIPDKRWNKLKKKYPFIPKPPFRIIVLGQSGAGKSSWVYSMLNKPYKKFFDQILVFSGTLDSNSAWQQLKTHDNESPEIFNEWDSEMVEQYLSEIEKEHAMAVKDKISPPRILMIIDDMVCDGITNRHRMGIIDKLFVQISRHYNVSVMILTQFYHALNRNVRAVNQSHICLYPISKNDLEIVCKDHCPAHCNYKEFMNHISNIWERKPYNYAMLDYTCTPDKRLRDNMSKIIPIKMEEKIVDN